MDPRLLPDNIRRLIDPAQRKELGLLTNEEIDAAQDEKEELAHQKKLCGWLDSHEIAYWHSRTDKKTRTRLGTPDFVLVRGNRALVIEVKGPSGTLSPAQKAFQALLQSGQTPLHVSRSLQNSIALINAWIGELDKQ